MTMPTHGPISLGQVRAQLHDTGTTSMNEAAVRCMAGKPHGILSLHDFYGKQACGNYTLSVRTRVVHGDDWEGYLLQSHVGAISPNHFRGKLIARLEGQHHRHRSYVWIQHAVSHNPLTLVAGGRTYNTRYIGGGRGNGHDMDEWQIRDDNRFFDWLYANKNKNAPIKISQA